ncbi:hypothetical protein B566_EDAN009536 [Ephemera danica]|nr:hypothetical protein B566_EDAN009536 [Ephemera danica]
MGRKSRAPRIVPEQDRRICVGICVCQLTAVLSCVALVYLSVAVYMPAHRALSAGLEVIPAMCQTRETILSGNCSRAACGEWCLTKSSTPCTEIRVIVRNNGSNIRFCGGTVECPPANEGMLKSLNCNNDDECKSITGVFTCKRGHCSNLSEIYNCKPVADGSIIDATKDNLKLNGFFECVASRCRHIRKTPFPCDRYCSKINTIRGNGDKANVLLLHGDNVEVVTCARAVRFNRYAFLFSPFLYDIIECENKFVFSSDIVATTNDNMTTDEPIELNEEVIWTPDKGVLMAACLKAERKPNFSPISTIIAEDCINGTTIPESKLPMPFMNFTTLWALFEDAQKLRNDVLLPPPQQELEKFPGNISWLFINLEGCVNTLRGECAEFVKIYGRDGTNHTGEARFPCFYNANSSEIVVARHDLERTRLELILAAGIPGCLLILSCLSLCACTRTVQVGDDAKMRCNLRRCCCCCGQNHTKSEACMD